MYIPNGTPFQAPTSSASEQFQQESPTFGQEFGNVATNGITPKAFSFVAENAANAIDFGMGAAGEQQETKLSADQVNAMAPAGSDGKPSHITDEPMYQSVADMLIKDKQRQLVNEDITARYSKANGIIPAFAASAAGFIADPANLAMTAYGGAILGSSRALAGLGAVGVDTSTLAARMGARAISGAVGGSVSQTPLIAAQYGISAYQNGDYDMKSALSDFAFCAAMGAVGHAGFGAATEKGLLKPDELMRTEAVKTDFKSQASDLMKQPTTVKASAMNSTIADIVNDRPPNPEAVIGRDGKPPNLEQIAEDRARQNRDGYSPNLSSSELAEAKNAIIPDGIKVEPKPSRIPDEVVNRYKKTVSDELANRGITGLSDDIIKETARVMAESHEPVNAAKPRTSAEVDGKTPKVNPQKPTLQKKPQTPIEVAPRAVPVPEPKLPAELSKSAPRWSGGKEVAFESDIDRALYVVGGKGKSAGHEKFMSFLDKAGLTKQQIAQGALDVREAIKQNAKAKTETINVPKVFHSDKPIEITVPNKRTVSPYKNPNVIQLAAEMGGLKPHGDLTAMGAEDKFVPGRGRLIRDTGRSLHELGRELATREYTGFNAEHPPSDNEVLELIRRGLDKDHVYSEKNRSSMELKDEKAALDEYHEDLERHAGEMGIDTTGMKPEEIHAELEKHLREAADEHNALDIIDERYPELSHDYYPDMEDVHANETVPTSAHTADEPEVGTGNERSEAGSEGAGGVREAEPVNAGIAGRGTETEGANAGRNEPTYERVKGVEGEQGVMPGMEQSAKQAMQARGEKISPKVEQKPADEGLFAKSVVGGGDELDLRIAQAEKSIDMSKMSSDEQTIINQAYKEAAETDNILSDKIQELQQCLTIEGL